MKNEKAKVRKEYIYLDSKKGIVNVLVCKPSQNSKIGFGFVVQTYHFSIEQVQNLDFKSDLANCLNCPYSFSSNTELSGKCYTHKGLQKLGLNSMLKRLNKNKESYTEFNNTHFLQFMDYVNKVKPILVRFGAYGEPVLMDFNVVDSFNKYRSTGYTHNWRNTETAETFTTKFMASVHTIKEKEQANKLGFRTFRVINKDDQSNTVKNEINCPASKESGLNKTCIECGLCNGFVKKMKNIYINVH